MTIRIVPRHLSPRGGNVNRIFTVALLLTTVFCFDAFAKSESWTYGGVEYSSAFENTGAGSAQTKSSLTSVGVNLTDFTFWNTSNIGLYLHDGFLFPVSESITGSSGTVQVDLSAYSYLVVTSIIVGPGIRYPLNHSVAILGGIGLHLLQLSGRSSLYQSGYGTIDTSILGWNLGLGADLGIKFDIGNVIFFAVGASAVYDPIDYTTINSNVYGTSSGWGVDYYLIGVDPFVCIGINIFQNMYTLGKPK